MTSAIYPATPAEMSRHCISLTWPHRQLPQARRAICMHIRLLRRGGYQVLPFLRALRAGMDSLNFNSARRLVCALSLEPIEAATGETV